MRVVVLLLSCLALTASGCAPTIQRPLVPPPGFAGPALHADGFTSFDGARLALERWTPADGKPWAVIVGLHGMNDYAGSWWMAGPWFAERGIATYAYDQRGFGRSPGRGVWAGRELLHEDLRTLVELARREHPDAVIAVAGESMGGAVAITAFASERPPRADRLVLLGPAVWGWSSQPIWNRAGLWLAAHTLGDRPFAPPRRVTRKIVASDNMTELRRMGRDPNMIWETRPDAVYGLMDLMQEAGDRIDRLRAPVAFLYGRRDQIIPREPTLRAAAKLKPTDRAAYYDEGWHVLLRDYQAERVWADVASFLRDPSAPLPSGAPVPEGSPAAPNR